MFKRKHKAKIYHRKNEKKWEDEEDIDSDNEDINDDSENEIDENVDERNEKDISSELHSDSDSEAEIYKNKIEIINPTVNDEDYIPSKEEKELFNNQINSLRSSVDETNKKLSSLISNLNNPNKAEMKYGISYLDSKNNIMLIYLTNLVFYSILKSNGKSINNSPVINRLIYLKTLLEKSKIIDLKLKSQIDRIIKLGTQEISQANKVQDETNFRPRILENSDQEDNLEEEKQDKKEKYDLKYKIRNNLPEIINTPSENKSRQNKIEKKKEKIRSSNIYKDLKEKFDDNPYENTSYNTEYDKFMKMVQDHEEDTFTRIKVPKRELKKLRKTERDNDQMIDIGREFKDLNYILNTKNENKDHKEFKFLQRKNKNDESNDKYPKKFGRNKRKEKF